MRKSTIVTMGRASIALTMSLAIALGAVGMASASSNASRAHDHGGQSSLNTGAFGVASAVSATSVTVTPKVGTATTFSINSSTTFFQGRTSVPASNLVNGDLVFVRAASSAPTVALSVFIIPAPPVHAVGVASAVSATSVTVTPKVGSAVTFSINSSTKFFHDEQTATAAALANGDLVFVTAAASAPTVATSISIFAPPSVHVHGVASAVSATAVTVTPKAGAASTFTINSSTTFFENGASTPSSSLANGDYVFVTALASAPTIATSIVVFAPPPVRARGVASAVSATSVTVTPTGGTATTFTINPSTKFFQGFTAATAAALANGDLVLVTAAASAPTIATSIDVYVAPSSNGHGGGHHGDHRHGHARGTLNRR